MSRHIFSIDRKNFLDYNNCKKWLKKWGFASMLEIQINKSLGDLLYKQIEEQIIEQISSGQLKGGDPLPSVRGLSQELEVSMITTRRAYNELEKEGYVMTIPAKGTFVAFNHEQNLRELGLAALAENIDDLVYLALSLDISREDLLSLVSEHYNDVANHPDPVQKINRVLKRKSQKPLGNSKYLV